MGTGVIYLFRGESVHFSKLLAKLFCHSVIQVWTLQSNYRLTDAFELILDAIAGGPPDSKCHVYHRRVHPSSRLSTTSNRPTSTMPPALAVQSYVSAMASSRFLLYSLVSVAGVITVIANALRIHSNFYALTIHLAKSNGTVIVSIVFLLKII